MLFGVEVKDCKESFFFFEDTARRLSENNLLKSPYSSKYIVNPAPGFYVFYLEPVYPNLAPYGLLLSGVPLLLGAPWWSAIPGLVFFCAGVAHLGFYNYLWLKSGLRRKAKYEGFVRFVKASEVLRLSVVGGWNLGSD